MYRKALRKHLFRGWNTQEDIAERFDIGLATVNRAIENFQNTQMRKMEKEWNLSSEDKGYDKRKPLENNVEISLINVEVSQQRKL